MALSRAPDDVIVVIFPWRPDLAQKYTYGCERVTARIEPRTPLAFRCTIFSQFFLGVEKWNEEFPSFFFHSPVALFFFIPVHTSFLRRRGEGDYARDW